MSPEAGRLLMATARRHIGEHYINGAYGAVPMAKAKDDGGGCPCRPGGVTLIKSPDRLNPQRQKDPHNDLAVCAATYHAKQYSVCAGSWRTVTGGRWTDPGAWDLTNYLATLKSKPVNEWTPYFEKFTPRRAFGPGQKGEVYWGESCEGIRHFDCIGFISFCLWEATGKVHHNEIVGWRTPNPAKGWKVFDLKDKRAPKPAQLMDGDIIIKADHHIAFVAKDGVAVQAEDTDRGVTGDKRFSLAAPAEWTHLVRLP